MLNCPASTGGRELQRWGGAGVPAARRLCRIMDSRGPEECIPKGSVVVPFCGSDLASYKAIPKQRTTTEPMGHLERRGDHTFLAGQGTGESGKNLGALGWSYG